MQQHRIERLNKILFQNISNIVRFDLHDKRLEDVTIEYVVVSHDMRDATIFYSVFSESKKEEAEAGLNKAGVVIRKMLADSMNLRFTPRLHFKQSAQEQKAQSLEEIIEQDRERYES